MTRLSRGPRRRNVREFLLRGLVVEEQLARLEMLDFDEPQRLLTVRQSKERVALPKDDRHRCKEVVVDQPPAHELSSQLGCNYDHVLARLPSQPGHRLRD